MNKEKMFEELRRRARIQAWADNNPNLDATNKGFARGRAKATLDTIVLIFPELAEKAKSFFNSEYFKAEEEICETK